MLAYFVNGVYWQDTAEMIPAVGTVVVREEVRPYPYHGIIYPDPKKTYKDKFLGFLGEMFDSVGHSTLTEIEVSAVHLIFKKHYDDKPAGSYIEYDFSQRDGTMLVGTWNGIRDGKTFAQGVSRCLLTKFQIDELLDLKRAITIIRKSRIGD